MRSIRIKRLFALVLCFVQFLGHCALAHVSEANFWAHRQQELKRESKVALSQRASPNPHSHASDSPFSHAIPTSYGTFRSGSAAVPNKSGKVIIHIQDVHLNVEVQRHIAKTLEILIRRNQPDLVALEGAFEPFDFSWYRSYPFQDSVRAVADHLLDQKLISGPVHFALVHPNPMPLFVGVDDRPHYEANVDAYRQSIPHVPLYKQQIEALERELAQTSANVFGPELLELDRQVRRFRNETMSLESYLAALSPFCGAVSSQVQLFRRAAELESTLQFPKVERQLKRLVAELARVATRDQISALEERIADSHQGRISQSNFLHFLSELCDLHSLNLDRFPDFNAYVGYARDDTTAIQNGLSRLRLQPRTFILKFAEQYYWQYAMADPVLKPEVALERYENTLRCFLSEVAPDTSVFVVIEAPHFEEHWRTGQILEELGYRDILPEVLPHGAYNDLADKFGYMSSVEVRKGEDGLVIDVGGRIRVFAKKNRQKATLTIGGGRENRPPFADHIKILKRRRREA